MSNRPLRHFHCVGMGEIDKRSTNPARKAVQVAPHSGDTLTYLIRLTLELVGLQKQKCFSIGSNGVLSCMLGDMPCILAGHNIGISRLMTPRRPEMSKCAFACVAFWGGVVGLRLSFVGGWFGWAAFACRPSELRHVSLTCFCSCFHVYS